MSIARLAREADVSEPTVNRFAAHFQQPDFPTLN